MTQGFYLRLESVASPITPEEAIRDLIEFTGKLGIAVMAELNGVDCFAHPGDDPAKLYADWLKAQRTGREMACAI